MITETVGTGQTFSTISGWWANVVSNHTSGGVLVDDVRAAVSAGQITDNFSISGITDSAKTITITAGSATVGGFGSDQSFRSNVVSSGALFYNTSFASVFTNSAGVFILASIGQFHVSLINMQFQSTTNYGIVIQNINNNATADDFVVDSCIVDGTGSERVITLQNGTKIQNSLIISRSGVNHTVDVSINPLNLYCNTLVTDLITHSGNTGIGITGGPTIVAINNAFDGYASQAESSVDLAAASGFNATSNLSWGFTNIGANGQVSANRTVEYTNPGSDYTVLATSVKLKNHGTATGVPTVDIVGTTRSATTPTIGAFEIPGASPPAITLMAQICL